MQCARNKMFFTSIEHLKKRVLSLLAAQYKYLTCFCRHIFDILVLCVWELGIFCGAVQCAYKTLAVWWNRVQQNVPATSVYCLIYLLLHADKSRKHTPIKMNKISFKFFALFSLSDFFSKKCFHFLGIASFEINSYHPIPAVLYAMEEVLRRATAVFLYSCAKYVSFFSRVRRVGF